ncbi:DUF4192 family protein [Nonomuraea polychroma]|uniref:DUF4192 family protein n=1 Tax=Nonomuraea polychroma TaxID=46176 RepID=UPI003D8B7B36
MKPLFRIEANDPSQFLALLPALLGRTPADEIVVAFMRDTVVSVFLAVQLPIVDVDRLRHNLDRATSTTPTNRYQLIGYGPQRVVIAAFDMIRAHLDATHEPVGIYRIEGSGRDARMCQPDDSPSAAAASASSLDADMSALSDEEQMIVHEMKPVLGTDRHKVDYAALLACFDVVTEFRQHHRVGEFHVQDLVDDARTRVAAAPTTWRAGSLGDRDAARLAMAVHIKAVRAEALARAAAAIVVADHDTVNAHLGVWLDVMRRVHVHLLAAPAAVYSCIAYAAGQTLRAEGAAIVAFDADPSYDLAHIMHHVTQDEAPADELLAKLVATIEEVRELSGEPRPNWLHPLVVAMSAIYDWFPPGEWLAAARLVPGYPMQTQLEPGRPAEKQ